MKSVISLENPAPVLIINPWYSMEVLSPIRPGPDDAIDAWLKGEPTFLVIH